MSAPRLRPPEGGEPAPRFSALLVEGPVLDLEMLATKICGRYRAEFPDERDRYGEAGNSWCVHDNQHLLNWAVETVNGSLDMKREVAWLANILADRNFPTDRLARNLEIGAEVVRQELTPERSARVAAVLTDSADFVRSGSYADYEADDDQTAVSPHPATRSTI